MIRLTVAFALILSLVTTSEAKAEKAAPYLVSTANKSGYCKSTRDEFITGKWWQP